jgi:predicted PurR-regulated permease PerM
MQPEASIEAAQTSGLSKTPALDDSAAPISTTLALTSALDAMHGVALVVLAVIAVVYALSWAKSLLISLLLGILFAYTLNPLVVKLTRLRFPRAIATTLVMLCVAFALVIGAYAVRGQMLTILDQLPIAVSKLSAGFANLRDGKASTMQMVQSAAREIEKATTATAAPTETSKRPATRVVIEAPGFKLGNFLWASSMGAAVMMGQVAMVLFLTFFLLLSGDTYRRKLVRLAGPLLSSKKITVRILDDINESIQRYMLMLLSTNVLLALLTWITLYCFGLDNAGAWALAAGLLHLIPYLGPVITAGAIGTAAYMQFETLSLAMIVAGATLTIATLVGTFVTTWMASRFGRMNTAAIFVALLFWTWLWGVWGMLLSIPIMAIFKVIAQHVEQLHPVAELLGD